jgi:RNA 2',3'-cyclic 3'-phosphodiesterase
MRCFLGWEVPPEIQQEFIPIQSKLRESLPNIRLIDPRKIHITLAFLGNQPAELQPELLKLVQETTSNFVPTEVVPSFLDAFPSLSRPRVFWAGLTGNVDPLLSLYPKVKEALGRLNIELEDRPYTPHLTLAKAQNLRLNRSQEDQVRELLTSPLSSIPIQRLCLFESVPNQPYRRLGAD